jgi:hypothetical protein
MDDSQDGCLASRNDGSVKRDYGLPRTDGGMSEEKGANLIGDKSLRQSMRRSLRKRIQWKLLEH